MSGVHQYAVLRGALSREGLLDRGKQNGVLWDESSHEGVNWLRYSHALVSHLDADKPFHTDDVDLNTLKQMHNHYTQLRKLHIKTMIPHVKDALKHLQDKDVNTHKHPNEYLSEVYQHLNENGGHHWADKSRALNHMNTRIKYLGNRIEAQGQN